MIQGFVNATATPAPTRVDQGDHEVEYTMFVALALLLVVPCLVYCWKVGGLREACCRRRCGRSTGGPLAHGQDDFVDNMERAVGVGAFVGHPGGPHYRLMGHPQLLFVHGQGADGTPTPQATGSTDAPRMTKSVSIAAKLDQTAAAHNTILCEPSAPLASFTTTRAQEPTMKATSEQA